MVTLNLPNHPAHGKTAEHYIQESRACDKRRQDSFERCDTDGFVSQHANSLHSQLNRTKAEIIKNGGYDWFWVLKDSKGNIVSDKIITDYYNNQKWLVKKEFVDSVGRRYIPEGENSRVQKRLGLHEEEVEAMAWATLDGNGRGFSGNVWVAMYAVRNDNNEIILKQ